MESGSLGGAGSGEDQDVSDPQRKKKRYHRHTARQIQELERVFKECPHPDEKQRMQLSGDLGLEPRQIKFWFQNRRTQMKAQHERSDNCMLRAENDKIRCENIAMREALKNVICPSCGGPPMGDLYFDEHKMRMDNAGLKDELERVSAIAAKYIGRPISHITSIQSAPIAPLDLSMGSIGAHSLGGSSPSLNFDLLPGSSSSIATLPLQITTGISEMEKSVMADVALGAMDEVMRLLQTDEPLWMKAADGRDILNLDSYERMFPRNHHFKNPHIRREASRDSCLVVMNGSALVDMFMDANKWMTFFPTIVSNCRTIEAITPGMAGTHNGSLQLMHMEMQLLSPLVSVRKFYFLRCCQQINQGVWAIADVSFDFSQKSQFVSPNARKLPSGYLIQDTTNGYCKVTLVEHVELEEKILTHQLYRDLVHSGIAFGAERWLATLTRMCERFSCLMMTSTQTTELGGVNASPHGKRSMMKLAQIMVSNFCASISASNGHKWTPQSGLDDGVGVTINKSTDHSQPNGVVLSASTSIWLPVSSQDVFNFLRDERTRSQWDVLSNGNSVQEIAHIVNGSHPGNRISVLQPYNASHSNMLILQESFIDSSGLSLVIYTPIDMLSINMAMSGEDPTDILLLPSGFAILPDGRRGPGGGSASTSSGMSSSWITGYCSIPDTCDQLS
ncbi:hypothetical protein Sjap_024639 [Stephania japonica]|uniref:Uncharacterized protein n=1 Tax=Stephania japonica TaxID=461633 RepID=A0AAP0EGZ6_9MAGN